MVRLSSCKPRFVQKLQEGTTWPNVDEARREHIAVENSLRHWSFLFAAAGTAFALTDRYKEIRAATAHLNLRRRYLLSWTAGAGLTVLFIFLITPVVRSWLPVLWRWD